MLQTIHTPVIKDIKEEADAQTVTFTIEPLMGGYGRTLGNSLRRVLLSSISGAAVVAFKVDGANHEFTTLPGVKEDLIEIILNLKQLRFKIMTDEPEGPYTLELSKSGTGPVTGGDIKAVSQLEVVNPNHVIAHLDSAADKISLELLVGIGRGYLSIEDSTATYGDQSSDLIMMDALFSPVLRVRYKIEPTRVGNLSNLDRLSLTVQTDGATSPRQVFEEAAAILESHYQALSGATEIEATSFSEAGAAADSQHEVDERLNLTIDDLQLSARTSNALINNGLDTVKEIVVLNDADLRDLKGFGSKALTELQDKLKELGF